MIEDWDDIELLLRGFDIIDTATGGEGNPDLGEKHANQDVIIAVLESCGHPEDQVVSRIHPDGKGRCKLCGNTVETNN